MPTRDVERYTVTTDEWLSGKDAEHNLVDLRPEGMTLRELPFFTSALDMY